MFILILDSVEDFHTVEERRLHRIFGGLGQRLEEDVRRGGFYIPLAPPVMQHSLGLCPPLCRITYTRTGGFCSWQIPGFVSLSATKSACSAAAVKCLSGVGQPLSSVSGRKRYNTLDFPSWLSANSCKSRVPTGCCSPLLETQSQRDCIPLDTCNFLHTAVPKL